MDLRGETNQLLIELFRKEENMHKVLWDAVIKCNAAREGHNADERPAYCAGCPLGSECAKVDDKESKEVK